ncbi:hypothetical protein CU044_6121 [Streptomyces sp. L-9-10]|uniref:hypothetical protein n=1 Tax=unclassified Streptomyces TaxID=2593676 RepID=UPI00101C7074|nr:hypothetical protein [Streptomyces sp. L-9-10]RYJ21737.1 hypothetical protein CU044_6121 [Streptomyces sp. L-9-10]
MDTIDEEARVRAALGVLGIEVPDRLHQARSKDAGLRRVALWALLWRAAGVRLADITEGSDDYGYLVSAYEWPLAEDQPRRALHELRFTGARVEVMAESVAPWSVPVSTGGEDALTVDGWAAAAFCLIEGADALLGPLAHHSNADAAAHDAIGHCRHLLARAHEYLDRITEAIGNENVAPPPEGR